MFSIIAGLVFSTRFHITINLNVGNQSFSFYLIMRYRYLYIITLISLKTLQLTAKSTPERDWPLRFCGNSV